MESAEVHIASLVAQVDPDALQTVKAGVERLPGAEVYGQSDSGKLVIVLESESGASITDVIEKINNFDQVLNTALVYHQIESPEPDIA
jgi:periplasmic nitrate reductase NapD